MIDVVSGIGPRTGTSFVMGKLHEARLPVYWDVGLNIDGSEYDVNPQSMPRLSGVIVKLFPPMYSKVDIRRMILLERERESQIRSINEQADREGISVDAGKLIDRHRWISQRIKVPVLRIKTEDLNDKIGSIIDWMAEPFGRLQWH